MSRRHILHFSPRFSPLLGGIETGIASIVNNLLEYHFSVVSNALYGVETQSRYSSNCDIWRTPPADPLLSASETEDTWKLRLLRAALFEVRRHRRKLQAIHRLQPDMIHVHEVDGWSLLAVDNLLRTRFFAAWARILAAFSDLGYPLLLTKHYLFPKESTPRNFIALEDYLTRQFDFIQCVDRHIYERVERLNRNSGARVWFTPGHVDANVFRPQPWDDHEGIVVGYIGRYDPVRGIDLLIDSLGQAPPWIRFEFIVSASSRERAELQQRIGGRNVTVHFNVPQTRLPAMIRTFDVLLNPVLVEGISRVTLEAMASGRPVIMTQQGDRRPVEHGRTGFLIEPTASAIADLLGSLDESRRELRSMGAEARAAVEKGFGLADAMSRQRAIYAEVLRRSSNIEAMQVAANGRGGHK